jgi:hypothetical protein
LNSGQPSLPSWWPFLRVSLGLPQAIAVMFGCFLLADLLAAAVHVDALTGFGFAAGSAAAAGFTRRRELLLAVTTPPAIFLGAVLCGELIKMHLDHVALSVELLGANVFLTLSSVALWLFAGLAGALVIATVRGLGLCIRELREELASEQLWQPQARRPRAREAQPREAQPRGAAPRAARLREAAPRAAESRAAESKAAQPGKPRVRQPGSRWR